MRSSAYCLTGRLNSRLGVWQLSIRSGRKGTGQVIVWHTCVDTSECLASAIAAMYALKVETFASAQIVNGLGHLYAISIIRDVMTGDLASVQVRRLICGI